MPRHTDDPRIKGVYIKLTVGEDAEIRAAAKDARLDVSVWARRILLRAIERRKRRDERAPRAPAE